VYCFFFRGLTKLAQRLLLSLSRWPTLTGIGKWAGVRLGASQTKSGRGVLLEKLNLLPWAGYFFVG